ncbi:MAG: hypothetical protein PHS41_12535 [Victivallaceae bacterium]|nr:hypothetical protein [Victivallaceae bacterium]
MKKMKRNFAGGMLAAVLLCCGGCGQNKNDSTAANGSQSRQANVFEMPTYSRIVNAYNDIHYKKNLGQDFNAIIGLIQGGKTINRDGVEEMDFCSPVRGKNDNLSWSFDLSAHEKELAEALRKDGDGYYRMKTEEYKANPSEENLHPVNPTIRAVNAQNEDFAVARLDQSSFPRCSAEVIKKIAPETADARYQIMEKPGQTNDGEHSAEASAWKITENLYFLLTADFSGAWHPRTYCFILYDGTGEPEAFASFDSLPSTEYGRAAINSLQGNPYSMNNLAVLMYRGEVNRYTPSDELIEMLLTTSAERGCLEAMYNLGIFYRDQKDAEKSQRYFDQAKAKGYRHIGKTK